MPSPMHRALAVGILSFVGCASTPMDGGDDDQSGDDIVDVQPDASPPEPEEYTSTPGGCDDALADIYTTPAGSGDRGDVVRCAAGMAMTADEVDAAMDGEGAEGVSATTGVHVYKIAYRTVRGDGSPAVTTATVWLPDTPREAPAPIALIARSTSGIADACAPSHEELPMANQALPYAARGYVAIAPDFAGLGNEGTHAYLDNHEAVSELFDGVLALEDLVGAAPIGDPVVANGYSQGGGIVLSAQALEYELTGKRTLAGVVAIAPEWPNRIGSFDYDQVLREPDTITGLSGLATTAVVAVMRAYGWFANRMGAEHAGDSFPEAERDQIISAIEAECTVELGASLGANQPHLGDLTDPAFRAAMLACIDGTAGCVEPAASFHAWMESDYVTADPDGADVLVIQGLGDQIMPAAREASCDVAKLRAEGVEPEVCSDTFATHDTILEAKIEHAVGWAEAAATGAARPSCSSSFLPSCAL